MKMLTSHTFGKTVCVFVFVFGLLSWWSNFSNKLVPTVEYVTLNKFVLITRKVWVIRRCAEEGHRRTTSASKVQLASEFTDSASLFKFKVGI